MATILQNKTVKMNIPQFVEGVFYALECEDYEELSLLKEEFYSTYSKFDQTLKPQVRAFLRNYIKSNELDPDKDLNNFFTPVLT